MRATANIIGDHEVLSLYPDLHAVKEWVKRTFTQQRIAEISVVGGTLMMVGFLGSLLYQGIQAYGIAGF